jgi:hypothetical protein
MKKNMSLIVIVKAVLNGAMDGLDKVTGVFVDRKNERTYFDTKISEDDRRISPVYADAPKKPDWFQIQIPGLPGQLAAVMNNGKVFEPILYKNKENEDRAKIIIRDGTVVHSWYRKLRGVYFGVQLRNGHPFLVVDERFVVEVPSYINGEAAVKDFLLNQGISGDLAKVAAKLKLSLFGADAKPRQYKDNVPTSGVNIGQPKDGLPGTVVAQSEPGDELGEIPDNKSSRKDKKFGEGRKSDKPSRKPKPEDKHKSNRQLLSDVKAGVTDIAAE